VNEGAVHDLALRAAETLLASSAPLLGVLFVVAVIVGLVQSVLQLQDAAIGFVPKLLALGAAIVFFGGFILDQLQGFVGRSLLLLAGGH
jgi:flagellar biosynthetic protein FliQ